jgi:hypothetical protein
MNKKTYFPQSYKEKTNPYPSGEWNGRTKWIISHSLPKINESWEFEYSNHNTKEEISSIFWDSAYDTEQEIYDTIDYNLWSTDFSQKLLEIFEYNKNYKEPKKNTENPKENNKEIENEGIIEPIKEINKEWVKKIIKETKTKKEYEYNPLHDTIENSFIQKDIQEFKQKDPWYKEGSNCKKNTKSRNPKNKKDYRRRQHTEHEPIHRMKKWIKRKKLKIQ